jgi:cell division protein FtsA
MSSQFLAGLDIGTSSIKAVVAERFDGKLIPRYFYKEESSGLRRGAIIDGGEVSPQVAKILSELKKVSKHALSNLYVNIGTSQIKGQHSRGIVAVSRADAEIYPEDIDRAVKAAESINVGPNRMVIHNVTREYIVDGVADINDPLGLTGNRLEVNSLVIDAFAPHVKSVLRVAEVQGAEVGGMVLSTLAAGRCALTKKQKDLGVAIIDLGGGTTGVAVYEESKLVGTAKFPVGAANISQDIAIGLKIPVSVAEQIKLNFGSAVSKDVGNRENIDVKKFYPEARGMVSRRFVGDIIESRLAEIFEFVNNEIKLMGKSGQLAGGAVLVGGGAKMPGITELVRQELKLSTQIGIPAGDTWDVQDGSLLPSFEDPEFITALGLVLWGNDRTEEKRGFYFPSARIKDFFKYFIP